MRTSLTTDEALIASAREGDTAAFKTLVERYEGQIAGTVVGMLGNGQEAEDVGQEVFIRFYRSLDKFRGDAKVSTYLTRIAINLSLNAIKKNKRRKIFGLFGGEEKQALEIPDSGLTQDQRDTQAMVQRALLSLSPEFRSVVVLRLIEGYSTKEVAQLLEIPLGTVLSRLARAQNKLKDIIQHLEKE